MRWDWFEALETPQGDSITFDFHNEWLENDDIDMEMSRRLDWRRKHQVLEDSVEVNAEQAAEVEAPTPVNETTAVLWNQAHPDEPRDDTENRRGNGLFAFRSISRERKDQPRTTTRAAPEDKKEIFEIMDDNDEDMKQPIVPAMTPPAAAPAQSTTISQKHTLEDDEEMLKLQLANNLIRQKRRKKLLKRQDQNVDLDEDDELDDMLLEENEMKQALRRKQLN